MELDVATLGEENASKNAVFPGLANSQPNYHIASEPSFAGALQKVRMIVDQMLLEPRHQNQELSDK